MTSVLMDGQQVDKTLTGREKVGDVIGSMATTLDKSRCVVKVHLDGEDITGKADRHLEPIGTYSRLEVMTGEVTALAHETIQTIAEFHETVIKEFSKAAEEFRMGDVEKSNQILVNCLDGLEIVVRSTQSAANLLKKKASEIQTPSGNLMEVGHRINEMFDEMIEAQTQQDTILLADLIEYELIPVMEDWRSAFQAIRNTKRVAEV
ncbi:hypothetical protein GF324_00255 [bacterium]|nr:hypothetical protein [bacterium]